MCVVERAVWWLLVVVSSCGCSRGFLSCAALQCESAAKLTIEVKHACRCREPERVFIEDVGGVDVGVGVGVGLDARFDYVWSSRLDVDVPFL